jgi:hypothetical protein
MGRTVARVAENLVGKPKVKRTFVRYRRVWQDNIETSHRNWA